MIRNAVRTAIISLKPEPSIDLLFLHIHKSHRCASSASSINSGNFVSTGFQSSESRRCIEVHAEETKSSEKTALGADLIRTNALSRRRPIHHSRNNLNGVIGPTLFNYLQNPEGDEQGDDEDINLFSVPTTEIGLLRDS